MKKLDEIWGELVAEQPTQNVLQLACAELIALNASGTLADGLIRQFAARLSSHGYPGYQSLPIAQHFIEVLAVTQVAAPAAVCDPLQAPAGNRQGAEEGIQKQLLAGWLEGEKDTGLYRTGIGFVVFDIVGGQPEFHWFDQATELPCANDQ